jgi:hypothetical protein
MYLVPALLKICDIAQAVGIGDHLLPEASVPDWLMSTRTVLLLSLLSLCVGVLSPLDGYNYA